MILGGKHIAGSTTTQVAGVLPSKISELVADGTKCFKLLFKGAGDDEASC